MEQLQITLKRKLKVLKYKAQMDLRLKKNAGTFYDIMKLAKENEGLSEEILIKRFHFTHPMAKRTIQRCQYFKLIEKNPNYAKLFPITPDGRDVALNGSMFRQESGKKYRIYLTKDALVPQEVLTIQRIRREFTNGQKTVERKLNLDGVSFQNIFVGNERDDALFLDSNQVIIEKCYEHLIQDKRVAEQLTVSVHYSPKNERGDLRIEGTIQNKDVSISLNEKIEHLSYTLVFFSLLKQIGELDNWDEDLNALRQKFDSNHGKDINYQNFIRKITVLKPEFPEIGIVDPITFYIPIVPANNQDCLDWEKLLLKDKINGVCLQEEYSQKEYEVENMMFSKNKHHVNLPSQQDFAEELRLEAKMGNEFNPRSEKYWFLQASLTLEGQ
jgi:hypothetical protein